jgi:hypothetical protein
MTTPAAVIPLTEDTVEAYRVAIMAYRRAFKAEREKWGSMRMNPHIPKRAAVEAVLGLLPRLSHKGAYALAYHATCWAAQAHWHWFWKGVSPIAD